MNDSLEFSRPLDCLRLGTGGTTRMIAATAEECAALAARFGLIELHQLDAELQVAPLPGGFYRLTAMMEAALVQACTVTLEPVESRIVERFTLVYGPVEEGGDILIEAESELVEPIEGGVIDLGEAVAQQLSLALDPFPRAPGVPAEGDAISIGEAAVESPFAALAKLRNPGQG